MVRLQPARGSRSHPRAIHPGPRDAARGGAGVLRAEAAYNRPIALTGVALRDRRQCGRSAHKSHHPGGDRMKKIKALLALLAICSAAAAQGLPPLPESIKSQ